VTRSVFEWLVALAALAGIFGVVAPFVERWLPRPDDPVTVVEIESPARPPGVSAAARPVPFLMLPDGAVVRVGASEEEVAAALPSGSRAGPRLADAGVFGERRILSYAFDRTRFWVVLERTKPGAEHRATAIYVE
jgi:hypothetical protein